MNRDDALFLCFISHGGTEGGSTYFGCPFLELSDFIKFLFDYLRIPNPWDGDSGQRLWDYDLASYISGNQGTCIFELQPCNSGGFIDELSGDKRIICTSSRVDQVADDWFVGFTEGLTSEGSIADAYEAAVLFVKNHLEAHPNVTRYDPLIDDNSDHIGSYFDEDGYDPETYGKDGYLASRTFLGINLDISSSEDTIILPPLPLLTPDPYDGGSTSGGPSSSVSGSGSVSGSSGTGGGTGGNPTGGNPTGGNPPGGGTGGGTGGSPTLPLLDPTYYTLTVQITGEGYVSRSPSGETYEEGTEVTLTATPDTGWHFNGWSGDASGSSNTITITMNNDMSVTATFVNQPPVATFTYSYSGNRPRILHPVTFDGDASYDPDGSITEYDWYHTYGTIDREPIGTGSIISEIFFGIGYHTIELEVTDNGSLTDSYSVTFWIYII
jgi:uncharacterized repeat protein (TIGR02543 family)